MFNSNHISAGLDSFDTVIISGTDQPITGSNIAAKYKVKVPPIWPSNLDTNISSILSGAHQLRSTAFSQTKSPSPTR